MMSVPELSHRAVARPAEHVLTPREIFRLFAVPGACAGVVAGALLFLFQRSAGVSGVEDLARQLRWLGGTGLMPEHLVEKEEKDPAGAAERRSPA